MVTPTGTNATSLVAADEREDEDDKYLSPDAPQQPLEDFFPSGTPAEFLTVLRALPAELLLDDEFAGEMFGALCNQVWQPLENPNYALAATPSQDRFGLSFRSAGRVIAGLRNAARELPDGSGRTCLHCGRTHLAHIVDLNAWQSYCTVAKDSVFEKDPSSPEDYSTWHCYGNEGEVSDQVARTFARLGWEAIGDPRDVYENSDT